MTLQYVLIKTVMKLLAAIRPPKKRIHCHSSDQKFHQKSFIDSFFNLFYFMLESSQASVFWHDGCRRFRSEQFSEIIS